MNVIEEKLDELARKAEQFKADRERIRKSATGGAPEQAPRGSLPRDKSASNTGEPGPISSIETHPIPGILNDLQNRLNA